MRIAHIITRMILGGAQENTLFTCRDLVQEYGDDVLLITGPSTGPEGSLLERAAGQGVPLEIVPSLRRSIHLWHDWRAYRAIRAALQRFQPEVVHTHSAKGGFLGRLAAWSLRVPAIVHTVHGAPYHPYQSALARQTFRWCERYAARRCHKLVSVADAMTRLLVGDRVAPADKFVTVYSGMEVEPFLRAHEHRERMRRELGFTNEHVVIGKLARLAPLKGHDDVLAAAQLVVKRFPLTRFLFVGDGALRSSLERTAAASGLAHHVRFTGLVPPERVPEYLGAMDLLVHASLREGLARALPQALIAGKPVVSYDIDGAREVVLPDITGFLLPPRDVSGLAAALVRLVGDATLRARLGQAGQHRFTEQFRHEHMTRQLRKIYQQLLSPA